MGKCNFSQKNQATQFELNQTALELVSRFKLLGLHIESHLSWKLYLEHLTKVRSPKVGMLCRLSKILPQNVLITLYLAIIQPHIDYAITLWMVVLIHTSDPGPVK